MYSICMFFVLFLFMRTRFRVLQCTYVRAYVHMHIYYLIGYNIRKLTKPVTFA